MAFNGNALKGVLHKEALSFSEQSERMSFVAIQRPMGAHAILLRQTTNG